MPKLRLIDDDDQLHIFDLSAGGVLGRDPEADFVVDHPTVSRRHAAFQKQGEEIEVSDLGSANGTLLNARPIGSSPFLLAHGDQLQFGGITASYHSALADSKSTLRRTPGGRGSRGATVSTGNVYEQDLRLGRLAQRRMLIDRPPTIAGYELGHLLLPAQGVGGDFIHWGRAADGRLALAVGDVCGKGVPAAMYMAFVSGLLVEIVPTARTAREILGRLNRALHAIMEPGMFVTAHAMLLDPDTHRLELSCAGHVPPLLRIAREAPARLSLRPGTALGLAPTGDMGGDVLDLARGDMLLVYTDGLDEARNTEAEEFGDWRVLDIVQQSAGAVDTARRLHTAVRRFAAGCKAHDDLTLVALERVQ